MKAPMRFFPASLVLVAALLAAAPLAAQFGAIEGKVVDENGKLLVGAKIVITRTDMRGRWETKTNKKGEYTYMGMPSGPRPRYDVELYREGQLLWKTTGIQVGTYQFSRVDFDMSKLRKQQVEQMTEEERRQLEEMRKQQEKAQSLEEQFKLGEKFLAQKQYGDAITAFEAAVAIDPEQYAAWANLGQAYAGARQNDRAIEAYEKATALNASDAGVYNNLGRLYAQAGRVEGALQAYKKAAELDPARAGIFYFNLGATLVNVGQMKAAVEPLQKSLKLDPSRAAAYYWLGVCLYASAESKIEGGVVKTVLQPGTVEAFEKYLELEPNGRYATDARQNLQLIAVQVPASVRVKKKK
ncbi:MAG: tetratricopeptide repeat protein [Terriglobia bacterium]